MVKRIWLSAFLLFIFSQVDAQLYLKNKSRDYLNKTARIVRLSHEKLPRLENREKIGYFAKAVKQQRAAKYFYERDKYHEALCHSHYGREMAFIIFMEDNPNFPKNLEYSDLERSLVKNCPTDEKLQEIVIEMNPGIKFEDEPYEQDEYIYNIEVE